MYTLLISGLVIFTSAHVASVALTKYILGLTPATTMIKTAIDVPAAAKATLARHYPEVKVVKWEKEDSNDEAGLTHNGQAFSRVTDDKGNVLETETSMAVSALPASVRDYVTHHAAK